VHFDAAVALLSSRRPGGDAGRAGRESRDERRIRYYAEAGGAAERPEFAEHLLWHVGEWLILLSKIVLVRDGPYRADRLARCPWMTAGDRSFPPVLPWKWHDADAA